LEKTFDKYKADDVLSAELLQAALRELGVQEGASSEPVDLEGFKRIARRPSQTEQWAQSLPLAKVGSHLLLRTALLYKFVRSMSLLFWVLIGWHSRQCAFHAILHILFA